MAGLSPADISAPIRSLLAGFKNINTLLGNVSEVNLKNQFVKTEFAEIHYDYLVLACGAKHSYFGHPQWETDAPGLKTLEQATEIRRRVLLAFELAEREVDKEKQKQFLTFVVVGGGPTGVELAGALGEISRHTLNKDFRNIDSARTRVILIEAGARILPSFSENLSKKAARDLEELGVQIWTLSRVTEVNSTGVKLGNESIVAATVVWAAGVEPSSLNKSLGVELAKDGRVLIEPDLSLKSESKVFVIGDQSFFTTDKGTALPGLAPVALQQGQLVAKNILSDLNGKERIEFRYKDKGQMATIGRKKAIVEIAAIQFSGFFAWLTWLVVHIYYLIGFRNRLFVLLQWAWSYLTFKRGARLILGVKR
jgi:NADH dehydrogenase